MSDRPTQDRVQVDHKALGEVADLAQLRLTTSFRPGADYNWAEKGRSSKVDEATAPDGAVIPISQVFESNPARHPREYGTPVGVLRFDPRDVMGRSLSSAETIFEVRADRDSSNSPAVRYEMVQGGRVDVNSAARMLRSMMVAAADMGDHIGAEFVINDVLPGADAFREALGKLKSADRVEDRGGPVSEMSPHAIRANLSKRFEPIADPLARSLADDVTGHGRTKLSVKDSMRTALSEGRSPRRAFRDQNPGLHKGAVVLSSLAVGATGLGAYLSLTGQDSNGVPGPDGLPDDIPLAADMPVTPANGDALDAFDDVYGTIVTVDPATGDSVVVSTTAPDLTTTTVASDGDLDDNFIIDSNELFMIREVSVDAAAVVGNQASVWVERQVMDPSGQAIREIDIYAAANVTGADVAPYVQNPNGVGAVLNSEAPANINEALLKMFPSEPFEGVQSVVLDRGQLIPTVGDGGSSIPTVYVGNRYEILMTWEQLQGLRGAGA